MEYTIPHYFEQFRCTASECKDTCCAGWAIMIDDASLEKYKNLEGAFGNRVKNSIDWKQGCFHQYEHRCAFLNDDNLCDLHIEGGEHMLCDTCRDYPRHMEEFEGLREGSLSLSCIEAAKLILGGAEPVQFIKFEDDVEDEEYEDFDYLLFTKLMDAREKMTQMMQNREVDIQVRMAAVLELAHNMQTALDKGAMFEIDELLESFGDSDYLFKLQQRAEEWVIGENEYCSHKRKMFRIFQQLEVLKPDWPEYIKKMEFLLFGDGQKAYEIQLGNFHQTVGIRSLQTETWSIWLEHLMVYFIFTYFCGAVYDGNIIGKMKIAIVATLLIQELAVASWKEQGNLFGFDQFVDIAHRVSREIEHSDVNILRMEKVCEKTAVFQTEQLLRVILYS